MEKWAIGVDLGGTKIEIAKVSHQGKVVEKIRVPTDVEGGANAIEKQIQISVESLIEKEENAPQGIGIGVAAQIDGEQGVILNAPNLKWENIPFQENIKTLTKLPTKIQFMIHLGTKDSLSLPLNVRSGYADLPRK